MSEGRTVWEDGYATGVQDQMRRAVTLDRVLQDLIAELRDCGIEEIGIRPSLAATILGQAEQQLKGLSDE